MYQSVSMLAPMHGTNSTINEQFVEWQEEDMKRKYANLEFPDDMMAMTRIWPRSRLAMRGQRQKRQTSARGRPKRAAPVIVRRGRVVFRARPILRPILFNMLRERMRRLLDRTMPWSK